MHYFFCINFKLLFQPPIVYYRHRNSIHLIPVSGPMKRLSLTRQTHLSKRKLLKSPSKLKSQKSLSKLLCMSAINAPKGSILRINYLSKYGKQINNCGIFVCNLICCNFLIIILIPKCEQILKSLLTILFICFFV